MSDKKKCFVIMPYGTKEGVGGKMVDFNSVYNLMIRRAVEEAGLDSVRCDEIKQGGEIRRDMIRRISEDPVVIVDTSALNPNVFYELGIRHALKRCVTILIREHGTSRPFNIEGMRDIEYTTDADGIENAKKEIGTFIRNGLEDPKNVDSPVYEFVPWLVLRAGRGIAFSKNYSERLKKAVDEVFCKPNALADVKACARLTQQFILPYIQGTVEDFLHRSPWESSNDVRVNANYMVGHKATNFPMPLQEKLPPGAPSCGSYLVLPMDEHNTREGVEQVLPVLDQGAGFGATESYASRSLETVPDTLSNVYPQEVSERPQFVEWYKDFFTRNRKSLRSYASMPISYERDYKHERVGVLNIEFSQPNVLSKEDEGEIDELLKPFRFVLGVIINAEYPGRPWL